MIPWLVLMFLVSWLFDPTTPVIKGAFFWVFLINAVIAAVIYVVAVMITLPTKQIEEYIEQAADESEIEEKTLAGGAIG